MTEKGTPVTGRRAALCRLWLMRHDPEGQDLWRALPPGVDFEGAVRDNLGAYGDDETGQAYIALEAAR